MDRRKAEPAGQAAALRVGGPEYFRTLRSFAIFEGSGGGWDGEELYGWVDAEAGSLDEECNIC